jgi:hypothetical protein
MGRVLPINGLKNAVMRQNAPDLLFYSDYYQTILLIKGRVLSNNGLTFHGGHKRQLIRPRTNNFLSLVWNITKLPHRIELAIPKNPIVFVFRFCYFLARK